MADLVEKCSEQNGRADGSCVGFYEDGAALPNYGVPVAPQAIKFPFMVRCSAPAPKERLRILGLKDYRATGIVIKLEQKHSSAPNLTEDALLPRWLSKDDEGRE